MKAKVLGRLELLAWINFITMSDYPNIEQLSDGVAFCQLFDAFFPKTIDLLKIKCKNFLLVNSSKVEDWEKNFTILNDCFLKIKCNKNIDVQLLAKGKFNTNFEFLQFVYDYILKLYPNEIGNVNYHAYNKRIDILSSQYQNFNMEQVRKYLPGYLIPNENIIKQDFNNKLSPEDESEKERVNTLLNKYKDFLTLLKDDLKKNIENNLILSADILEIEEERNYYLEKLITISDYCKEKSTKMTNEIDLKNLNEVMKILSHVPEDFK